MDHEENEKNQASVTFAEAPSAVITSAKSALVPNNLVTKLQSRFNKQSFKSLTNNNSDVCTNANTTEVAHVMGRFKTISTNK